MNYLIEKELDKTLQKIKKLEGEIKVRETELEGLRAELAEAKKFFDRHAIEEAMSMFNGHDRKLVRAINCAWNNKNSSELFQYIIPALMLRDKDEVLEKFDCNCIEEVVSAWDNCLYHFLTNVCDDTDLIAILNFVRWDIEENKSLLD
jgi:hypothetical protein